MDDIVSAFASQLTVKVKSELANNLKGLDMEVGLPLLLTAKQCKKLLGVANNDEFQRIVNLPDFPKIDKGKGSHVKYPRDAVRVWFSEHWKEIA